MKKKRSRGIAAALVGCGLLFLGFLCYYSARWYLSLYGSLDFNAILFTLLSGLGGLEQSILVNFFRQPLSLTIYSTVVMTLLFGVQRRFHLRLVIRKKAVTLMPLKPKQFVFASFLLLCVLAWQAASIVMLPKWVSDLGKVSALFQEEYVSAEDVNITFPEEKRNLIYIYAESMESTYFSKDQGGQMAQCLIPELYELAMENTSFSDTDKLGGWGEFKCTTWSTAGIIAQTGGMPLLLPFGGNSTDAFRRPLASATLLWDILEEEGYYQAVMMGYDKQFSDQVSLMECHGIDRIYDWNTAITDGVIPPDYNVWWGMEDSKLFDYAKQELLKISAGEQPFQFTLATIDTHMPEGYICSECPSRFAQQYENVVACSSAQIAEFVTWIQQQPFYENTTVIICGDHLSMANKYFASVPMDKESRRVYNCIINAAVEAGNTKNRTFSPMDMYPTTLAAMGCSIEGDRLGLGVNLYSDLPTLAETMGVKQLNRQISRSTIPYLFHFLLEPGKGQWLIWLMPQLALTQ